MKYIGLHQRFINSYVRLISHIFYLTVKNVKCAFVYNVRDVLLSRYVEKYNTKK